MKIVKRDGIEVEIDNPVSGDISRDILAISSNGFFYVMATKDGNIYDPADKTAYLTAKDNTRVGYLYQLQKCNKLCYECYIGYLRTGFKPNLNQARREILL